MKLAKIYSLIVRNERQFLHSCELWEFNVIYMHRRQSSEDNLVKKFIHLRCLWDGIDCNQLQKEFPSVDMEIMSEWAKKIIRWFHGNFQNLYNEHRTHLFTTLSHLVLDLIMNTNERSFYLKCTWESEPWDGIIFL